MLRELPLIKPVAYTVNSNILDLELLANLGQLQVNFNSFVNPSFLNALFLPLPLDFKLVGSFSSIYLLEPKLSILLGA